MIVFTANGDYAESEINKLDTVRVQSDSPSINVVYVDLEKVSQIVRFFTENRPAPGEIVRFTNQYGREVYGRAIEAKTMYDVTVVLES